MSGSPVQTPMAAVSAPRVSFGVPVYNEESSIRRCLDSLLAQDFKDFEVVVCDNASTDRTRQVVEAYGARDPRVRLYTSETNLGLIQNFNRVFQQSRGEFFRWIGADDWLEPSYTSRCVAALDADPDAIVATADLMLHESDGRSWPASFEGERLESPSPARRFTRVLWFFYTGAMRYEPLYSLIRRSVLARTGVIRNVAHNDLMLVAELSLIGRFTHVPELLFHRAWRPRDRKLVLARMSGGGALSSSTLDRLKVLVSIARAGAPSPGERARCYAAIARFCSYEMGRFLIEDLNRFRRTRLGWTRERLRNVLGGSTRA